MQAGQETALVHPPAEPGPTRRRGAHGMQLSEPLRSMLIGHIQADGTDPMRSRMRHGYYGAERSD
ncbi:hypothetical protein [Nonomuraea sp. NPDC049709]|uniref:hypothetical protein n=1 Tax=Nonomuraea sp. NPDC049709 TaxID=3154736 RepID=UPI003444A38F